MAEYIEREAFLEAMKKTNCGAKMDGGGDR